MQRKCALVLRAELGDARGQRNKQRTAMPSMPGAATKTPGRCWAPWALTASPERCSVRPSGPKRLRGRPIPARPCAFADRAQPPRTRETAQQLQCFNASCRAALAAQQSSDSQARADAAMGFWASDAECHDMIQIKFCGLDASPKRYSLEKLCA